MADQPRRFRKKPVVIEAMEFTGSNAEQIVEWASKDGPAVVSLEGDTLRVLTLESRKAPLWASPGDWIIRGVKGEYYPIRGDVLWETYEEVGDEPEA